MSGNQNGVQALVRAIYKYALFVHCVAHRLNLVLGDVIKDKQLAPARVFFSTLEGFGVYFSNSSKRSALLGRYCGGKRFPSNCATR